MAGDREKAIAASRDEFDTKLVELPRLAKLVADIKDRPNASDCALGRCPTFFYDRLRVGLSSHARAPETDHKTCSEFADRDEGTSQGKAHKRCDEKDNFQTCRTSGVSNRVVGCGTHGNAPS